MALIFISMVLPASSATLFAPLALDLAIQLVAPVLEGSSQLKESQGSVSLLVLIMLLIIISMDQFVSSAMASAPPAVDLWTKIVIPASIKRS